MDVKLEDTEWHRISAEEVSQLNRKKKKAKKQDGTTLSSTAATQKKKILMLEEDEQIHCVESDSESQEEFYQAN